MKLRFLSSASSELANALEYYQEIDPKLGSRFLAEIDRCLILICEHPQAWKKFGKNGRRIMLRKFPYGLAYAVFEDEIVISAIIHLQSDPVGWESF